MIEHPKESPELILECQCYQCRVQRMRISELAENSPPSPAVGSMPWMDALEASVASAISYWHEFGPEHEFEKCIDWLEVRLKAYRRHKESASIGAAEQRRVGLQ